MGDFQELKVWQRSKNLAVFVYQNTRDGQFEKDYGLKDQMTRAGISIASNIAEGAERGSPAEFIRFLHIAKGSAAELRTQIYIASRIGVVSRQIETELVSELKSISSMIHALIKSIKPKT